MNKIKNFICGIIKFINRLSHWIDIVILYFIADYLQNTVDNDMIIFVWILPILQLINNIKWEYRCWKSKQIVKETALNKRVQGFAGSQGAGKTSFMLYCAYILNTPTFSNFPCSVRGKYTYMLDKKVLTMQEQVPEESLLLIDEATMLFHNLVSDIKDDKTLNELYAQQLQQQIVRHCYNGNMFYSSVDLTRLPQILRDNMGMTNYLLGQGSVRLSYITSTICAMLGSLFGLKLYNSIRFWDVQQLERIPEKGYTFDLSRQEKDTDTVNYANLIRFCSWSSENRFDYDDRFLRGIYAQLPKHINKQWESLEYNEELLREIGYGSILDFFETRTVVKPKNKR